MLSEMGAQVTIACRNTEKAQAAAEDIEKTTSRRPEVVSLDLSKLDSVAAFIDDFKARHERLDILVNNAGVVSAMNGAAGMTQDGFETE
jgi:NAD(P)-dependent dehydrogenase (short-subunit alcohol dehydrogenase family)